MRAIRHGAVGCEHMRDGAARRVGYDNGMEAGLEGFNMRPAAAGYTAGGRSARRDVSSGERRWGRSHRFLSSLAKACI